MIDFAKIYFPNEYNDFNETSPGMMFIEMASYVGDVLSYYIDSQFKEMLLGYAEERENVVAVEIIKYKDEEPLSTEYDIKDLHVDFNSSKRNIIESLKKHGNFLRSEEIYS